MPPSREDSRATLADWPEEETNLQTGATGIARPVRVLHNAITYTDSRYAVRTSSLSGSRSRARLWAWLAALPDRRTSAQRVGTWPEQHDISWSDGTQA